MEDVFLLKYFYFYYQLFSPAEMVQSRVSIKCEMVFKNEQYLFFLSFSLTTAALGID